MAHPARRPVPPGLGYLACLSAILLVALHLGRLILLDPASPAIVLLALLNGFLVNPTLYLWFGLALLRGPGTRPGGRA